MKSKAKLLAIIGSHRKNANSYLLTKNVLDSTKMDYEIIQLAEKRIDFCDLCEKCIDEDCVLTDDFNQIFEKMKKADGIVFAVPKYIFFPSKFLCFLERLNTIDHMRKYGGYVGALKNPDYRLFQRNKPFCVFFVSGTGVIKREILRKVVDNIKSSGLKPVRYNLPPFIGASVKSGDYIGEVLKNKEGMKESKELTNKLITLVKGDNSAAIIRKIPK